MRVARLRVRVERGSLLWVSGPARVSVIEGSLYASGVRVEKGSEMLVQAGRGASLYAVDEDATVELVEGSGASHRVERDEEAMRTAVEWLRLVDSIAETRPRLVAVLGPVESGKSTLSLWLANRLGGCYASLDPGQNELGTPCYYSAAPIEGTALSTKDLRPRWAWLVGCNAPEQCPWESVSAAAALASYTRRACSTTVVDTDGFVSGPGLAYKTSILETLEPDATIVMERGPARQLARLARLYSGSVYTAPATPERLVRSRSRRDRRVYRERMYQALFANAEKVRLDAARTPLAPPVEPGKLPPGLLASLVAPEGYEIPALIERASSNVIEARVAWGASSGVRGVRLGSTRLVEWREERVRLL